MPHHGEAAPAVGGFDHHFRYLWYEFSKYAIGGINFIPGPPCRVFLSPINVPVECTIDRLMYVILNSAGNVRSVLYEDNGDTPAGGAMVVQSASVAMVGLGKHEVPIVNTSIIEGEYWLGIQGDDALGSYYRSDWRLHLGGTLQSHHFDIAGGYGVFPDPCPAVIAANNGPISALRVVSVP